MSGMCLTIPDGEKSVEETKHFSKHNFVDHLFRQIE